MSWKPRGAMPGLAWAEQGNSWSRWLRAIHEEWLLWWGDRGTSGRGNCQSCGTKTFFPVILTGWGAGRRLVRIDCWDMLEDGCCCLTLERWRNRHQGGRPGVGWGTAFLGMEREEWGKLIWEGRTNLRLCIQLWQLPYRTTRCHQMQNPLETQENKARNLNP